MVPRQRKTVFYIGMLNHFKKKAKNHLWNLVDVGGLKQMEDGEATL